MPVYTYACTSCGADIERRQSFSDAPLTICEVCGGKLRRVLHPVGVIFKGSGFYNTDNRKSPESSTPADGSKDGSKGGGKSADGKDGAPAKAETPSAAKGAPAGAGASASKAAE